MVVDKAQFDATLTNLQTKFDEVSEELGRVSIECDVWRTKFLASRFVKHATALVADYVNLIRGNNRQFFRDLGRFRLKWLLFCTSNSI